MLTKDLVLPLVIAGALGLPMFLASQDESSSQRAAAGLAGHRPAAGAHWYPGDANGPDFSAGPLEFLPLDDWQRALSFELSPAAIQAGFPRATPVASAAGWQALRSELITGTGPTDLHGCVTWHVDARQQVQRISFRGWTGDPARLKQLLVSQFGLAEKSSGPWTETLLRSAWGNRTDAAIIQRATAARPDLPQQQFAVWLELNRPGSGQGLSVALAEAVDAPRSN